MENKREVLVAFNNWLRVNYKHSKGGYRMRGDFENRGTIFTLSQLIDIWCRL